MRYVFYSIAILILISVVAYLMYNKKDYPVDEETLAHGKVLFTKHCMSCHGLQEDGIGPPLGGITNLLPRKVSKQWIEERPKTD